MATVNKKIVDDIIAGLYEEDGWVKIVKYQNAWGSEAYGAIALREDQNKYHESEFVINPTVYWERKQNAL